MMVIFLFFGLADTAELILAASVDFKEQNCFDCCQDLCLLWTRRRARE
jgi:hypothetical protein